MWAYVCHLWNDLLRLIFFWSRDTFPPAEEYLSHAEKANISLIEAFRGMQMEGEETPLENGDSGHEVCHANKLLDFAR